MSVNCWEYKKCGREPNGHSVSTMGICPAATETRLNGIHGGINAGRACWVVSGTFCEEEIQGTFADKVGSCIQCDFYKLVLQDSMDDFIHVTVLARMLLNPTPEN